jgi:hypothetical protein
LLSFLPLLTKLWTPFHGALTPFHDASTCLFFFFGLQVHSIIISTFPNCHLDECLKMLPPRTPLPTLPHVNPHSSLKVLVFGSLFLSMFGYYL